MRCKACDTLLNQYELSAKDNAGKFHDLCSGCLSVVRKSISDIDAKVDIAVDREYDNDDDILISIDDLDENYL